MEQLSAFFLASILLTLSPGPDLLMVMAKSLERGSNAALFFTAGLMTGLCAHTLLLIMGWPQIIGDRPYMVTAIKWMGCFYFCYLGVRAIRQSFTASQSIILAHATPSNHYKQGLLMNLLNPKVSLFFWMFFPGFLFSKSWTSAEQYMVLGTLFLLQAGLIFTLVAFFAAGLKGFFDRFNLGLSSGLLWIILGIYLVLP